MAARTDAEHFVSERVREEKETEEMPVIVTLLALLVFGYIKGSFTTAKPFRSAWQTVVVGGLAAAAAFGIAKAIG